jgi:hypothetical protein
MVTIHYNISMNIKLFQTVIYICGLQTYFGYVKYFMKFIKKSMGIKFLCSNVGQRITIIKILFFLFVLKVIFIVV